MDIYNLDERVCRRHDSYIVLYDDMPYLDGAVYVGDMTRTTWMSVQLTIRTKEITKRE